MVKNMKLFALALFFVFPALAQTGDDTLFTNPAKPGQSADLDAVSERLRQVKIIRARFQQKKKLAALRRPLKSTGSFLFAPHEGVYWHTEKPFANTLILTEKGIYQCSENAPPFRIEAAEQPVVHSFTRVFMSMFSGDSAELEKKFDLYFEGDPQKKWRIGLEPKGKIAAKMIQRIIIDGSVHFDQITLLEPSGDRTEIMLEEVATEPELSNEERASFDF